MTRPSWDEYAMTLADAARSRSEDPYVRVGCCLLRADHSVAALGYNGAPPGVKVDWTDREARRPWLIHAEMNALRYVKPGEVETLASTYAPCHDCLKSIASYGIRRVLFGDRLDPARYDDALAATVATATGIQLIQVDYQGRATE